LGKGIEEREELLRRGQIFGGNINALTNENKVRPVFRRGGRASDRGRRRGSF